MLKLVWTLMSQRGPKNAMLDNMLAVHDKKLGHLDNVIAPTDDASPRNPFTSTVPVDELSIGNISRGQRLKMLPTMLPLMWHMNRSAAFYERPFPSAATEAGPELFSELKAQAESLGATALCAVTLPDDVVFKGLGAPHRKALVYTVRMDKAALDTAPSFEAFLEVAKGYKQLAIIGNALTRTMRKRGHAAYPGTALGGLTDYSRLAEVAGLGAIGYHGVLITENEGALLRINTIYTSVENFPEHTGAHDWVRDFCDMCGKCVRECPPSAIHKQPIVIDNGRVECIDTAVCLDYFARHFGCAICIDVCPFTQSGYDVLRTRFKGNDSAPRYTV